MKTTSRNLGGLIPAPLSPTDIYGSPHSLLPQPLLPSRLPPLLLPCLRRVEMPKMGSHVQLQQGYQSEAVKNVVVVEIQYPV